MQHKKLSQFYTKPEVAEKCYNLITSMISLGLYDVLLEPSAGTGSFLDLMDTSKRLGIDLEPKANGIRQQDYFTFAPESNLSYIVIGNPPFGKNSSIAVKFFNHSNFADYICFIVPKTFRKDSIVNRLDKQFHKICDVDIEDDAFFYEDQSFTVPCCFQIWEKRLYFRNKIEICSSHPDFEFVSNNENFDFLFQRVGEAAGTIKDSTEIGQWSPQSHFFIKSNIGKDKLISNFAGCDFSIKYNTAGCPSISRSELVKIYSEIF